MNRKFIRTTFIGNKNKINIIKFNKKLNVKINKVKINRNLINFFTVT